MAKPSNAKQIDLLFGVAGGNSINGASGSRIKGQLDSLVRRMNQKPFQAEFTLNTIKAEQNLKKIENQLDRIKLKISEISSAGISLNAAGVEAKETSSSSSGSNNTSEIKKIGKEAETAEKKMSKLEKKYQKILSYANTTISEKTKLSGYVDTLPETIKASKSIDRMEVLEKSFKDSSGGYKSYSEINKRDFQEYVDLQSKIKSETKAAELASISQGNTYKKLSNTMQGISAKAWQYRQSLTKLGQYPELQKELDGFIKKTASKNFKGNVADVKSEFLGIQKKIRDAGVESENFGDAIQSKITDRVKYLVGQFAINFIVQGLRRVYDNVLQIDTAMTELKKVTDETDGAYEKFLTNASNRAKELGATLVEVINVTSDYARLGFSVEEASELADVAIIYHNVGDGLKDTSEATDHIISTMKAFKIEANDAIRIVDAFNEVSNNFAVTSSDIGAGLQRSAAAMYAAGNSMEETIALFTAGNTIVRDADSMGTSLKTMSMRLRATKTELESMGEDADGAAESVSSLQEKIKALTGVEIMKDDTSYKNTYEILKEISKEWENLNDITRSNVLNLLFGQRQANVGAAIISNFNIAEEALETALDSAGSAVKENEKYLESIQGHLDRLTASFQALSNDLLDGELVKFGVDFLNTVLNLLDKIIVSGNIIRDGCKDISNTIDIWVASLDNFSNLFNMLLFPAKELVSVLGTIADLLGNLIPIVATLVALDSITGFKHVKETANWLSTIKQIGIAYKAAGEGSASAAQDFDELSAKSGKLQLALGKLFAFIKSNPLISLGIGAVIAALTSAIAAGVEATLDARIENQMKDIDEAKEKYNSAVQDLEKYNEQLEVNALRLEELNAIPEDDRTLVEQEELNKLERENELLEANIAMKEREQELARQEAVEETKDAFLNSTGYAMTEMVANYGRKNIFHSLGFSDSIQESYKYKDFDADGDGKSDTAGSAYLGSYMSLMQQIETYDAKILEITEKLGGNLTDSQRKKYEKELARYEEFKNDAVAQTSEMKANLLQWRNDLSELADEGDEDALTMVTAIENAIYGITTKQGKLINLLSDSRFADVFEFLKKYGNDVDITQTEFGNIDLNNRQVIKWTEETLKTYKKAIESWGWDPDELEGTVSDVLGTSGEYEGIEIAFSPILQTSSGPKLLTQETVDQYMFGLIEQAKEKYGEDFTIEHLIELDAQGIGLTTEDGEEIKGLVAAVGDGANKIAEAMHYLSEFGSVGRGIVNGFIKLLNFLNIDTSEIVAALNSTSEEIEEIPEVEIKVSTEELDAAKESIKSLSSSCKTLADAFKEQNENGSLSVDTILDVIEAGYGAALAVDAETGAVTLNADMYLVLAQAELAATKLKWLDIRASYEQQYAQAQEAISTGELGDAYKDLAEAELAALTAKGHLAEVDAILKSIDSIDLSNVTAGIYGVGDAAKDAKSKLSNLQSGMESLLSQTISWLKQEYSDAQEAQEKLYDSQIDSLEKAKDAAKERWDAEKEALEDVKDSYNDIIDAQIELLKRQKDADDYAKSRAEKEKAVSDIEAQLLAIQNDDSIEAQKMRLELEEQLKEAQDELDELQSDREYELREQALQDEKDRYNDEIDAKIEAIEKQSEAEEKAYQERIDRLQDYLDAVRDAEKTEAQWRAEA